MRQWSWVWPAVLIVSTLGAVLVALGPVASPARPLITFWFLLICPGLAFTRLLSVGSALIELTLGIVLSLGIETIIALFMVYTRHWWPNGALGALAAITLVGATIQLLSAFRNPGRTLPAAH
jgi:hypothetical protein